MARVGAVSGSVKEVLILAVAAIAFILILPKLIAMIIRSSGEEAGKLVGDAVQGLAVASQPLVDSLPGAKLPVVIGHPPSLSPANFPTTPVGQNVYGVDPEAQQSQPYVDYLRGAIQSGTETNGVVLTTSQEAAFLDPIGDAQFVARLAAEKEAVEAKPWWQVW